MRQRILELVTKTIKDNWGKDLFFEAVTDSLIEGGIFIQMPNQTGVEFGSWIVLESLGKNGSNQYYKCQCKICGQTKNVAASNLLSGKSTKCNSCKISKMLAKPEVIFPNEEFLEKHNLERSLHGQKPVDKFNVELA